MTFSKRQSSTCKRLFPLGNWAGFSCRPRALSGLRSLLCDDNKELLEFLENTGIGRLQTLWYVWNAVMGQSREARARNEAV